MRVTLNISAEDGDAPEQDLLSLEIPSDTTISSLKEMVQAELRIPKTSQHLYHNGQLLSDDTKTMHHLHIGDGDMLALHVRHLIGSTGLPGGHHAQQAVRRPTVDQRTGMEQDPEVIRLRLLGNPQTREQALRRWPELAAAIDNPARFAHIYRQMLDQERQEQMMRVRQIAELNADPFDVDAQMRIAEIIREEAVQENLQNAMEHNPEGKPFPSLRHQDSNGSTSVWTCAHALHRR
jgi:DNA damage-inducible protein 1